MENANLRQVQIVLCFNTSSREWINPKASGSLPAPRSGHTRIILEDKVCANLRQGQIANWIASRI